MDHLAQAHGLGRTGVEGVVNPESANCAAHQLAQPDADASDKATWLTNSRVRESFVRSRPERSDGAHLTKKLNKKN